MSLYSGRKSTPTEIRDPIGYERFSGPGSDDVLAGLYDFGTNDLYIKFSRTSKRFALYVYSFVPATVWEGLKSAANVSRYLNDNIAYDYRYEQLTPSDWPQQGRGIGHDVVRRFVTGGTGG